MIWRDTVNQGTKYNGSGCLIHGLTVVSDSLVAVDHLLAEHPEWAERLITALKNDFREDDEIKQYLISCPKFGNNNDEADNEAVDVAIKVSAIVSGEKNYLGNAFRPDFSTPSTHLLYGYHVAALPCGRGAREMLNYGVDPALRRRELGARVQNALVEKAAVRSDARRLRVTSRH